jgi:hypothetical protein
VRQLVHCAVILRAAGPGGAINVSGTIENEIADSGDLSIGDTAKSVDSRFHPRAERGGAERRLRMQVEDCAATVVTGATVTGTAGGGAVQCAVRSKDHSGLGPRTIAAALEVVKRRQHPAAVLVCELEYRAAT